MVEKQTVARCLSFSPSSDWASSALRGTIGSILYLRIKSWRRKIVDCLTEQSNHFCTSGLLRCTTSLLANADKRKTSSMFIMHHFQRLKQSRDNNVASLSYFTIISSSFEFTESTRRCRLVYYEKRSTSGAKHVDTIGSWGG